MKKTILTPLLLLLFAVMLIASATGTHSINLSSKDGWGNLKYYNFNIKSDTMSTLPGYDKTVDGTMTSFDANKTVMGAYGYDINSDGNTDLITVDADGYMRIFRNKKSSNGKYGEDFDQVSQVRIFPNSKNGYGAGTIGDFDGDGELDLFFINKDRRAAYVSDILSESPVVQESSQFNSDFFGSNYNANTWASQSMTTLNLDYETDEYPEVIYITRNGNVYALDNSEESGFTIFDENNHLQSTKKSLLFEVDDLSAGGDHAGVVDYGDFNSDGIPDLVCGNTSKMAIYIYLGNKDETTKRIEFDTDNRITLIDHNGRLNEKIDHRDYRAPTLTYYKEPVEFGGESNNRPFSPTVLRIDDNVVPSPGEPLPDIVIGTDAYRSSGSYGKIVYAINNVKIDLDTNEILSASVTVLNEGGNEKDGSTPLYDLDAGTLGDINGDGYTDVIFTDGNQTDDFAIYKSIVNDYYTNHANYLSKTLDVLDPTYRNKIENGIFTKGATVTFKITEDKNGNIPPGFLYCELLQGPPKRTDKLDLKEKYNNGSKSVQIKNISDSEKTLTMYFEFDKPRAQPQLFFEFYSNDQKPMSQFIIDNIDIDLLLSDEITLVISNISWQKN